MGTIISWLLSKVSGPTLIFLLGSGLVLGLWAGIKYYKGKAERIEAEKVVVEETLEVEREHQKNVEETRKWSDDQYGGYWGSDGVRPDDPRRSKTPAPDKGKAGVPGPGQK